MQPKAKFWVDFFNYLFRSVTFKKIIPQPRKTKRKNYHVALKPNAHNSQLCYSENPNETEQQNLGEGHLNYIFRTPYRNDTFSICVRILAYSLSSYWTWIIAMGSFLYFHYQCYN